MKTKCEYCTFDKDGFGKSWSDEDSICTTRIGFDDMDNTYYLETETDFGILAVEENAVSVTADIEHCPMCGRKLSEDKHE